MSEYTADQSTIAADFSDRAYYVVVLRDDQVDRIAKRVVELLRPEPGTWHATMPEMHR